MRLYPFFTYTEAKDRMAFIHTRLIEEGYNYQRSIHKDRTQVQVYTQTGEGNVYVSYRDE